MEAHTRRRIAGGRQASMGSPAISVRGLTKRFGDLTAVEDLVSRSARARHRVPGTERLGQEHHAAHDPRPVEPTEGTASVLGMPYRELDEPARTVGAVLETQSFHPLRSGRNHLRALTAQRARRRSCRRGARAGGPGGRGPAQGREVLAGDAAASRPRGRPARRAADPDPGRTGERARPAGDPLAARLPPALRGRGNAGSSRATCSRRCSRWPTRRSWSRGRLLRQASLAELTRSSREIHVRSPPRPRRLVTVLRDHGMQVAANGGRGPPRGGRRTPGAVGTLAFESGVPVFGLAEEQTTLEDVFFELTAEEAAR